MLKKKEQLDALRGSEREAERVSQNLDQAVSLFYSDMKVEKRSSGNKLLISFCYLLDRSELPHFESAYREFESEHPSLKLLYTGPWAPYSFADIDFEQTGI